jgi:hypothetical protein
VGVLNLFGQIGSGAGPAANKSAYTVHRLGHFFATNRAIHFIEDLDLDKIESIFFKGPIYNGSWRL